MDVPQEFLALPACAVVRKMTAHTVADITCLPDINNLAFVIVEIINTGCIWQLLDLFFWKIGRKRLLA